MLLKTISGASATLAVSGSMLIVTTYDDPHNRAFVLGVTLLLIGCMGASTALVCSRSRTLSEEYEAGYRMGYRAGRKNPLTATTVTPIRRVKGGLSDFNRAVTGGRNGRVSKTPIGSAPSHGAPPGRTQVYQDGPA